ncbi:hypothetical protein A3I42_01690 [Candidatus Uhrbacteria bacterium RIFCSPLOWO2_02_FULL_49_11]|uniref:Uncharacterized protein n=1 Tax=Candidatus Uhrbacteria bacterium RIFCSPLOWO2_02_FULL_49_11 TaxID=1802409 RepID=A0A1F7VE47_9BACT|nr:MAG: hypothetical protein A3I42_01690 [Candidatus Uhrbacteria bacterium RIFCSPLOWO2_02_FULL_49_11]
MATTLTKPIAQLLEVCQSPEPETHKETVIHVDELVSRAAFLYEKIRNAVDYREDHLLRRGAIERMLKRLLVRGAKSEAVAKPLVIELIRARYLNNDALPERIIGEVGVILERYIALWNAAPAEVQTNADLFSWMLGVAAREVEEAVAPSPHIDKLVESMYRSLVAHIKLPSRMTDEREKNTQLFIAIHRALVQSDLPTIRYKLFAVYAPGWKTINPEQIGSLGWNIASIAQAIERDLSHPIGESFARHLKRDAAAFTVLHDIIEERPKEAAAVLTNPLSLEDRVRRACQLRYKRAKEKLGRSAVRSIIFIFFTKMLLAIVLEIPYEIYLVKAFNPIPLLINVTIPPFLLFLVAATTKVPTKKNTEAIIATVRDLVEEGRTMTPIEIRRLSKPIFSSIMLGIAYLTLYGVTFGFIIWGLRTLHFNIISGALFLLFLSLVSFFAIRIRQGVRRLVVIERKENVFTFLFDLFTIPVIRAGRWISIKSSNINIFVFILDFLIETPFKSLLDVTEEFTTFIKEKKEEVL